MMIKQIQNFLLSLGIKSTYLGYRYLAYALYLCLQNEDYLTSIYKTLYTDVASYFHTNRCSVEHCLRTVIKHCWDHGNRELLMEITKYPLSGRPTNSEFIDILYHYLSK